MHHTKAHLMFGRNQTAARPEQGGRFADPVGPSAEVQAQIRAEVFCLKPRHVPLSADEVDREISSANDAYHKAMAPAVKRMVYAYAGQTIHHPSLLQRYTVKEDGAYIVTLGYHAMHVQKVGP